MCWRFQCVSCLPVLLLTCHLREEPSITIVLVSEPSRMVRHLYCVCVYIYIYTHTYVHNHRVDPSCKVRYLYRVCLYIYIYIYIHTYIYVYIYMHNTYMHIYEYIYTYKYVYVYHLLIYCSPHIHLIGSPAPTTADSGISRIVFDLLLNDRSVLNIC